MNIKYKPLEKVIVRLHKGKPPKEIGNRAVEGTIRGYWFKDKETVQHYQVTLDKPESPILNIQIDMLYGTWDEYYQAVEKELEKEVAYLEKQLQETKSLMKLDVPAQIFSTTDKVVEGSLK